MASTSPVVPISTPISPSPVVSSPSTDAQYIEFSTMTGFTREMVLAQIYKVLPIARRFDGEVFGGFVRNVIVPRSINPKCDVSFKDVDLWFKEESSATQFVDAMGAAFRFYPNCTTTTENKMYPFERKQYHYIVHGTCVAWFDVIISKEYPVDDFDVNCLTYKFFSDGTRSLQSYLGQNVADLKCNILAKRATLLPSMVALLLNRDWQTQSRRNIQLGRIENRYRAYGWSIFLGADEYTKKEMTQFISWIRLKTTPVIIPPAPTETNTAPVDETIIPPAPALPSTETIIAPALPSTETIIPPALPSTETIIPPAPALPSTETIIPPAPALPPTETNTGPVDETISPPESTHPLIADFDAKIALFRSQLVDWATNTPEVGRLQLKLKLTLEDPSVPISNPNICPDCGECMGCQ